MCTLRSVSHLKAGEKLADLRQTSLPKRDFLANADLVNAQTAMDDLYTKANDAKVQAMQAIANNAKAVKDAQYQLDNYTVPTEQIKMGTMEAVDLMEKKLDIARRQPSSHTNIYHQVMKQEKK